MDEALLKNSKIFMQKSIMAKHPTGCVFFLLLLFPPLGSANNENAALGAIELIRRVTANNTIGDQDLTDIVGVAAAIGRASFFSENLAAGFIGVINNLLSLDR
jgi:hypothetical protein